MRKTNCLLCVFGLIGLLLSGCGEEGNKTHITEGMNNIEKMEYEAAISCFDTALEAGENERLCLRGKGIAYLALTQYDLAIESFQKCLSLSDGIVQDIDFDTNYYLGMTYYKNHQPEEAERCFDAILALRENENDARYLRGVTRLEQNRYTQAQEDFDIVIAANPKDCDRLIEIVAALNQNGYKDIAKEYLQNMLDNYSARLSDYDLGRLYFYMEDYPGACRYLENAKSDGNADSCLYLGRAYEATGDYNYAISVYNGYLANHSDDAQVYNQLGICRIKQGEYQAALEAFQSAMQIEDNEFYQALAFNEIVAYEYLGEFTKAAALMENYVRSFPDDAQAQKEYAFLASR